MCRRVDRCHLQSNHRITTARDSMAHNAVHVTFIYDGAGMAVVGAQYKAAWIEPFFRHRGNLAFHIIPSRPQSHHVSHPLSHTCDGICFTCPFMIICWTTCRIGMKGIAEIRRCIMPTNGFTCILGCRNFCEHLRITVHNAGEIHHLTKANDAGPLHRFSDVVG